MEQIKDEAMDEVMSPKRPVSEIGDAIEEEGKVGSRKLARSLSLPLDSCDSAASPETPNKPAEQWMMMQQKMKEVIDGQQAVMTEVSRVPHNQSNTEAASAQILQEIAEMMTNLRATQDTLVSRSQAIEQNSNEQVQSTLRLDRQTQERDAAIFHRPKKPLPAPKKRCVEFPEWWHRLQYRQ